MKSISKNIATPKEVKEQLESVNLPLLYKDLVKYAFNRMKGEDIIQAEKLIGDVFEKTVTGVRKWNKDHTFKYFLFGAVSSLVSQYNDKFGNKHVEFSYNFELNRISNSDSTDSAILESLKNELTLKLKEHKPPPNEIEEMVFECWMDGMKKPKDISDFWDLEIKEVYKAIKRLERKLSPIRELLNSKSHE